MCKDSDYFWKTKKNIFIAHLSSSFITLLITKMSFLTFSLLNFNLQMQNMMFSQCILLLSPHFSPPYILIYKSCVPRSFTLPGTHRRRTCVSCRRGNTFSLYTPSHKRCYAEKISYVIITKSMYSPLSSDTLAYRPKCRASSTALSISRANTTGMHRKSILPSP